MAGRDRHAHQPKVQERERDLAGGRFERRLADDERQRAPAGDALARLRTANHLHRRDRHQSVRHAGQTAEAEGGNVRRQHGREQAAQRADAHRGQPRSARPVAKFRVEQEERAAIEEQVIPGDVDEWMGHHAPPFAGGHEVGEENEVLAPRAAKQRQVYDGKQGCEHEQFQTK